MSLNSISSKSPLTEDELARDERNAVKGLHEGLKPSKIFGPKSDSMLASQVRYERPVLYRSLKEAYKYESGELRRPYQE